VSDTSTGNGKVVVNRAMSLDGFIAGPGDAMDWIFGSMGPVQQESPEIMAATGAMLVGLADLRGRQAARRPKHLTTGSPTARFP
jgi:hypothetical protein